MFRQLLGCTILIAVLVWPASAQENGQSADDEDLMSRPTQYGIRFTPGLARAMARQFTKHSLVRHYKMDKEKSDQANELVARRMMQLAHTIDGPAQELIERFAEEQFDYQKGDGGGGFMPPTFGKEFAERLMPMLPEVRNLIRGTVQDVRPLLPIKQQLKMAGELMAVNTAFDAFEETMKQWASGEVTKYGDPFHQNRKIERDESGQSKHLKWAKKNAEDVMTRGKTAEWEKYVKEAKELYQLDDLQSSSADSILRECVERANNTARDEIWRNRIYLNTLWKNMVWRLPDGWNNPLRTLIEDDHEKLMEPIEVIGNELKTKIDKIPTEAQLEAAEDRIATLLEEKGFDSTPQAPPPEADQEQRLEEP
ncbi:MAG: hypothetical protein JSV03_12150 [Planctomycetota bacterium]|nr:MAG: hypothetical protein JSV03_12150 [Planctomycetota bacterium]